MRKSILLKSTLSAVALLIGCTSINAQKAELPVISKNMFLTPVNCVNIKTQRQYGENKARMPQKVTEYSYENNEWKVKEQKDVTYDDFGNAIKEIVQKVRYDGTLSYTRNTYEYNENGMMSLSMREVSNDDMATWSNNKLNTFEYDNIVTDALVMQGVFKWDANSSEWIQQLMDKKNVYREILRDENGRVIQDQWWDCKDKTQSSIGYYLEYGNGENATRMELKDTNKSGELNTMFIYDDIVWYKCDNQHLQLSPNIYHVFTEEKTNLVSSYNVYGADKDGNATQLMAEYSSQYDEKDRRTGVKMVLPYDQMFEGIYQYDTEGENSYVSIERNWIENNGDGILDPDENVMFDCKVIMKYDEYGNMTLNDRYDADFDGSYVHSGGYMSEYTYDSDGTMLERLDKSFDKNVNDWVPMAKFVYEDFTDVKTSVENALAKKVEISINGDIILVNNAEGVRFTVCDMEGRIVMDGTVNASKINMSNLAKGLYVVRIEDESNTTFKMLK